MALRWEVQRGAADTGEPAKAYMDSGGNGMKSSAARNDEVDVSKSIAVGGAMAKRDAAKRIANGCRHVHSSPLGTRDPAVLHTEQAIANGEVPSYPWEVSKVSTFTLMSSDDRHELIEAILGRFGHSWKREMRERVKSIVEELVTNAIYHSYREPDGSRRFPRTKTARLSPKEAIDVMVGAGEGGVYLAIRDKAGTFHFDAVSSAFHRCYGSPAEQIESKESGAGLGLYFVFEAATHLKVVNDSGKTAEVSCWVADKKHFDASVFSFNFFERRSR